MLTWISALIWLWMSAQRSDDSLHLSLQQRFGRALFSECRLEVVTSDLAGLASMRCARNVVPPKDTLGRRNLSAQEVTRLIGLVRDSQLFAGGHIGTDTTASDGIFETITVSGSAGTAVLVTSGNDSFAIGRRRELLDFLHDLLQRLQQTGG